MPKKISVKFGLSTFGLLKRIYKSVRMTRKFIKESKMRKIELGITVAELMAMLPVILAAAWEQYSDDNKISAGEGVEIAAIILDEMAGAADDPAAQAFFAAQANALRAVADLLGE
jgi:hypothetical protein